MCIDIYLTISTTDFCSTVCVDIYKFLLHICKDMHVCSSPYVVNLQVYLSIELTATMSQCQCPCMSGLLPPAWQWTYRLVLLDLVRVGSSDLVVLCVRPDGGFVPWVAGLFREIVAYHLLGELLQRWERLQLAHLHETRQRHNLYCWQSGTARNAKW